MSNSDKTSGHGGFKIIEKDQEKKPFENDTLNGSMLNEGDGQVIEDGYQNVNIERDTNNLTMENVEPEISYESVKEKFDRDIKENGLHDEQAGK